MTRLSVFLLVSATLLWGTGHRVEAAEDPETRIGALEEQVEALSQELAELKAQQNVPPAPGPAPAAKPEETTPAADQGPAAKESALGEWPDWVKRIIFFGDFRYRYEYIDDQSKTSERNRNRIRARVGLSAKVNDEWNVGFRLATGEGTQGGDPVSTNQTLGGSWSRRPIWLDLAFLDYHPHWAPGLDLQAGKIEFPFYRPFRNELIWDVDLTPEGGALFYSAPVTEKTTVNLVGGGFWAVERATDVDTSFWGLQGYVRRQIKGPAYLLGGVSGYWYPHLRGQQALSLQWESPTANFFGNSNAGGVYTSNYDLFEAFAECGTEIGKLPVALYGDYVVNTVASPHKGTGWLIGGCLNRVKDQGSWQFDYDYRDLQADAAVGQFESSDFVGGGTGGRGHRFGLSYVLVKNVVPCLTYYLASYEGRNNNADYRRLEVDLQVKF